MLFYLLEIETACILLPVINIPIFTDHLSGLDRAIGPVCVSDNNF